MKWNEYPEFTMLVKGDSEGKFAGAVLVMDDNQKQVQEFCDGTEVPCTWGPGTSDEHGQFQQDKIRLNLETKLFYAYVEPEEVKLARELATAKSQKLSTLQQHLSSTDYEAIKFAEGEKTAEEYAEMKALRASWRVLYNQIQACTTIEESNAITIEKWPKTNV